MKLQNKSTTDFFNTEYVNYASYDNVRKIPSLVDGQKNAARKILWYSLKKNLKNEIKVSQLDSKVAEETEYLHGSMAGVIVNLAQDYIGTNNINMMMPEGNFGTRLVPEASAARYIYSYGSKDLFEQLNTDDNEILEHQEFEGHQIEPKFLLPKLPLLLINGAEGISSGYASKILPRNPIEIEKYLKYNLQGRNKTNKPFKNKPFYRGFNGSIEQGENSNQWIISGIFARKANKVHITELPIGYSLVSYKKVLDKLEDDKQIIGYQDLSNKKFEFIVQFNRKFLDGLTNEKLILMLKLQKKVSENYTVMDSNNRVINYNSPNDIFQEYMRVKIDYTARRKVNMIKTISQNIRELVSKYMFIKAVTEGTLIISKRATKDIEADMDKMDKIIRVEGSFDYLLNMAIRSLTKERMEALLDQIKAKKVELDLTKSLSPEEMWLNDL